MKDTKKVLATFAWTAAVAAALVRTFTGRSELTVWVILAAALGAWAGTALVLDYVAERCVRHLLEQVKAERSATIKETVEEIHKYGEGTADKIVGRLASKQDKTLERMAAEIAEAMREDQKGKAPSPIR